jgi:hypothetical protein
VTSEYDGIGWGYGPPFPWSHYGWGDSRCDQRPVFVDWARSYECLACNGNRGNRWVFSEQYAAYHRIFDMPQPAIKPPDSIPGFRWVPDDNGWGYHERIRNPDPARSSRVQYRATDEAFVRLFRWVVAVLILWLVLR